MLHFYDFTEKIFRFSFFPCKADGIAYCFVEYGKMCNGRHIDFYFAEFFLKCISAKESGLILLMNPRLVSSYLSLLFEILPKLKDKEIITRLARVLDFTDSSSKLFLHKVSNKYRKRFKSICSLTSAANETFDFVSCVSKRFIFRLKI